MNKQAANHDPAVVSQEDVDYVAKLAHLHFSQEQKTAILTDLTAILGYMQQLQEIDTSTVAPTTHVLPLTNVFRADQPQPGLSREQALANAPEQENGYFRVPKIL